jgi:hypothetical protein
VTNVTSSMGEGRPEPIHLQAQYVADGLVRVVRGDGSVVTESTSLDFVRDALHFLKTSGEHSECSVTILGVCGNLAFSGALKHA